MSKQVMATVAVMLLTGALEMKNHKKPVTVVDKFAEQRCAANVDFDQYRGRMIAPQQCAAELGVSEFTIHRWIREGKILAVKLSLRCTRVVGSSLADYMAANKFVPGVKEEQPAHFRAKPSATDFAGQA